MLHPIQPSRTAPITSKSTEENVRAVPRSLADIHVGLSLSCPHRCPLPDSAVAGKREQQKTPRGLPRTTTTTTTCETLSAFCSSRVRSRVEACEASTRLMGSLPVASHSRASRGRDSSRNRNRRRRRPRLNIRLYSLATVQPCTVGSSRSSIRSCQSITSNTQPSTRLVIAEPNSAPRCCSSTPMPCTFLCT